MAKKPGVRRPRALHFQDAPSEAGSPQEVDSDDQPPLSVWDPALGLDEIQHQPYLRLDLGISYRINKVNKSHTLSLDIQNSTLFKNIGGTYWDEEDGKVVEYTLMPIVPVINYRLEF